MVRTYLRKALERVGHEVRETPNAYEALDVLTAETPDVVITDILLPGMSGLQLARLTRRISTAKIVAITGGHTDELNEFDAVLEKPFNTNDLLSVLDDLPRTTR